MTEKSKFTPTDWDWVMFLSGEINAIKTKTDTVGATVFAILCAFIGILTVFMVFLITCSRISASNPDSIVAIIIGVPVVLIIGGVCILWRYNKYKPEAEKRVELLEKCREDIFNGLDDPNKILECYLNAVEKKR